MYRIAITFYLILMTATFSAAADEGRLVIGETRISLNSDCTNSDFINNNQIQQDTKSDAHQKCDNQTIESQLRQTSQEINEVHSCIAGKGGEKIYQVIYSCHKKENQNSLFDGDSSVLQSSLDNRTIVTPFMQSSCLLFRVTGLIHLDELPISKLEVLRSHLSVYENNQGQVLRSQILVHEGLLAIQYERYFRGSSKLSIKGKSSLEGASISDLIASDLGKSSVTGFKFGIEILPTECMPE